MRLSGASRSGGLLNQAIHLEAVTAPELAIPQAFLLRAGDGMRRCPMDGRFGTVEPMDRECDRRDESQQQPQSKPVARLASEFHIVMVLRAASAIYRNFGVRGRLVIAPAIFCQQPVCDEDRE